MNRDFTYQGKELELFEQAVNWKRYLYARIKHYLKGDILEVGAGIGATTKAFNLGHGTSWTQLEPDLQQYRQLIAAKESFPPNTKMICGDLASLPDKKFDTILYIDVLEHIEEDRSELQQAATLLNAGGSLIVLSPAFPFLFSEFDRSIGHFRRYSAATLKQLQPPDLSLMRLEYLDSLGFFASVMNKYVLHQNYPTLAQINFWDKRLIKLSRIADAFTRHTFGKSILAVWVKKREGDA